MSRIHQLGVKNANLPVLIGEFEDAFAEIEQHLSLTGKTLDSALKEQGSWVIYYAQRRAELKTVLSYLDDQVSAVRGQLAKRYVENYSRALGERVMNSFIDSEPEYLKVRELYLEVEDLYSRYDAAVNAFEKRGYALRDLTNARIHQLQNSQL
jgi:hypothetical protein